MQLRIAQIAVNKQNAATVLSCENLREIRRCKGLPFLRQRAADEKLRERLLFTGLVKAAAQGAELFHSGSMPVRIEKEHAVGVRGPSGLAYSRQRRFSIKVRG